MSLDSRNIVTFTAPTNIACIKYWGKDSVKLNTPMNSSVSVTLDQSDLHTITTVAASKSFEKNRLWLNGCEIELNSRAQKVIQEVRKIAGDRKDAKTGEVLIAKADWDQYKIHISSVNTFPTGAGLASSAAGLACMVKALSELFCVVEEYPGQITAIARQGSGSASRSLYGGFVEWQKGSKADGSDSIAVQVADEKHWPELSALILVVSEREKDTSSTSGMETSKKTSPLLQFRAEHVVDGRLSEIKAAYRAKDFAKFGEITMRDSNQFHATCLDTYPPIFYMNDTSHDIIRIVHTINAELGEVKAAYTFDAGPNAVIYTLRQHIPLLMAIFSEFYPAPCIGTNEASAEKYCSAPEIYLGGVSRRSTLVSEALMTKIRGVVGRGRVNMCGEVKYMFVTKAGPGPQEQPLAESLIDPVSGLGRAPTSNKHKRLNIGGTPVEGGVCKKECDTACCPMQKCESKCCFAKCCSSPCGYFVAAVAGAALAGLLYTKYRK